jgi:hypothetical protein
MGKVYRVDEIINILVIDGNLISKKESRFRAPWRKP